MLTIEVNSRLVLDLLGEKIYQVQLTVKDYGRAENPNKLHALVSFEIEDALLGILPSSPLGGVVQKAQPTTGRKISIEPYLRGAMRNKGTAYEVKK